AEALAGSGGRVETQVRGLARLAHERSLSAGDVPSGAANARAARALARAVRRRDLEALAGRTSAVVARLEGPGGARGEWSRSSTRSPSERIARAQAAMWRGQPQLARGLVR